MVGDMIVVSATCDALTFNHRRLRENGCDVLEITHE